jgi:hypothetical protein
MKKILSLLLIFCMIFAITACNTENQSQETTTGHDTDTEATSTSTGATSTTAGNVDEPEEETFFARILEIHGHSLFVRGELWGREFAGTAHLPQDISTEDYKKGDYVAITFPGIVMESYPPQIGVNAIRHLDKMELSKLPKEQEHRMCLQYMGQDETKITAICMDRVYFITLTEYEAIPEMTYGDYFVVIYEELRPYAGPAQILFIKELYLSDENGAPIE